jgi:hypothetical protein
MRLPVRLFILPTLPTLLAALAIVFPAVAGAADASMCTSLCTSARKECRAKVPRAVDLDRTMRVDPEDKNPLARAATRGQPTPSVDRIRDRSDYESRRVERNGMCDDTYQRCTRSCAEPGPAPGASDVLTPQGKARSGKS